MEGVSNDVRKGSVVGVLSFSAGMETGSGVADSFRLLSTSSSSSSISPLDPGSSKYLSNSHSSPSSKDSLDPSSPFSSSTVLPISDFSSSIREGSSVPSVLKTPDITVSPSGLLDSSLVCFAALEVDPNFRGVGGAEL